jgi:uncharacterized protein YdaU (DUF1376 family)
VSRALPWYKHCPRDFAAETRGWPLIAKAIYRELLDAAWDMADGVPAAPEDLRRLTGATRPEWAQAWPRCEPKFPVGDGGMRHSHQLEAARRKAVEISEKRSVLGRLGAERAHGNRPPGPHRVLSDGNGQSNSISNSQGNGHEFAMPSTSISDIKHYPDFGGTPPRKRARPASPEGPRARPRAVLDESSEEIKRKRAEAAALAEATR